MMTRHVPTKRTPPTAEIVIPNLTDWFPDRDPDAPGSYQSLVGKTVSGEGEIYGYQYWTGTYWGLFAETADMAQEFSDRPSFFQKPTWRGCSQPQ